MVNFKTYIEHAKAHCSTLGYETSRVDWLIMDLMNWSRLDMVLHSSEQLTATDKEKLDNALTRLYQGEPVQYIVGFQTFYGERFTVNENCLIPRPETEEVMLHFLNMLHAGDTIVDIGTGSGNIPIMLKKLMPTLNVYATDIASETLEIARQNARQHEVDIQFLLGDTLNPLIEQGIKLNGLISNPPYIENNEATLMSDTVLDYEPHRALFAEDNGLAIYKAILRNLPAVLCEGAPVVFEIGHNQGDKLCEIINELYPHIKVAVLKDINNNNRIVSFRW
ncbi:peptide chain release factor N(5)-glutamine methyltransferase [Staphylococcus arlettae]|uniref:peptide chain release factor N(5)-glutamine methyltransferase n=1 Tax=Staphylococcus TaxID=1279 RepID=UPI0014382E11|nr:MULTISPECIES: peptide chain release factor N(5)-glutamine methyltransferase [Staphylococcus]MEB5899645.1 peptide chain release factor N(5)-glutamine methyltransferase [Staphylococcus arlettae]NKE85827.1 peptide chain release factor N(5)-glutamine methyltransferase [Staphylococcus arlettae]URN39983.1 peptide chain release factor N(5)-glutamine methyltransferase [Staphylococcus arlettae]HJG55140.1 peptide chain release factor N(5)-glutamine methyltransferase [Staphylococcus arlettae]